jgi:hypothetical protein
MHRGRAPPLPGRPCRASPPPGRPRRASPASDAATRSTQHWERPSPISPPGTSTPKHELCPSADTVRFLCLHKIRPDT